jgi:hypothetical protein
MNSQGLPDFFSMQFWVILYCFGRLVPDTHLGRTADIEL